MKTAVQEPPAMSGIELANWNWKAVRRFVADWFGVRLCRSSSLNYLHRLGFAFKRPKKRLLKANEAKREAFVAEYAALCVKGVGKPYHWGGGIVYHRPDNRGRHGRWNGAHVGAREDSVRVSPNPPVDTDGRREDSGRGVRKLQAR